MSSAAKKLSAANSETLHVMLEQLESIDFCDCSEDLDMLYSIIFEAGRIKSATHHYIEMEGEFN